MLRKNDTGMGNGSCVPRPTKNVMHKLQQTEEHKIQKVS